MQLTRMRACLGAQGAFQLVSVALHPPLHPRIPCTELKVWTAQASPPPKLLASSTRAAPPKTRRPLLRAQSLSQIGLGNGAGSPDGWLENGAASSIRPDYDAIMVLGGGLAPNGGLPEWVQRRLEGALYIYKHQREGCPIALLGAGTPHKPPVIDKNGYVLHESTAYADYLLQKGVSAGHLLKELQSYDTVGNGYFSLVIHAIPAGWRNIAVVTSDFHMPRTRATFDYCYSLAGRQYFGSEGHFQLSYHAVSDAGIFDPAVIEARAEKESAAVAAWGRNTTPLDTMQKLHAWLFATHLCYSVSRQNEFGCEQDLDPRLAATY